MCARYPNKTAFPTKDDALIYAFQRAFSALNPLKDTKVLYTYQCPSCHQYHVTKYFQRDAPCEAVRAI
jgi:hypothetical protein